MMPKKSIQSRLDESRQLWKLSAFAGVCMVAPIFIVIFTGIYNNIFGFDSYSLLVIPYSVAMILAFSSSILGYFQYKAAIEEEDRILYEQRKEKMALQSDEDALFSAGRSLKNYAKFAPYVITALNLFVIGGLLFLFWRNWHRRIEIPVHGNLIQAAFVSFMLAAAGIFGGVFCAGQSREKGFRWLRPVGAWLILSSIIALLAAAAVMSQKYGIMGWDIYVRKISLTVIAVLGVELFVSFIIEFYRPRTEEEEKPLFESRILGLFTEPGGVAKNIANTLDYQFGFKVSRHQIYIFLENSITPLAIVWFLAFWLLTSVCEVGTNEIGIREVFGKRVENKPPLEAGMYFKLPWPMEKIARFPVYEMQEFIVGPEMVNEKGEKVEPEVILWTTKHYAKERRFLVAVEKIGRDSGRESAREDAPVSFLAASFPIQYRIRKDEIVNFAYLHKNTPQILKYLSEREITRYLASVDIQKVMSVDRQRIVEDLRSRIQKSADSLSLGVDIVFVNFHDAHPPTDEVAPAYQDVLSALVEKESCILAAKAYENKIIPETEADVNKIGLEASSYRDNTVKRSEAETGRFRKQLEAYRIMPSMFKLRAYLDFFENDCRDIRKIVISSSVPSNVFIINLEEKARLDLTDSDLVNLSGSTDKNKQESSKEKEE